MPGWQPSPANEARLVRLYTREGMTIADLARRFHVSHTWVDGRLRRLAPDSSQRVRASYRPPP